MTKPFKIVTHNDLDGGVSAVCILEHIRQKYGPDAKYSLWFGTYKNVDLYVERLMDNPQEFEKVFIADIHTHPDLAKQFPDNFILFDHHDSSKELNNFPRCIVDTSGNVCGAAMCYKYLLKDEKLEYKHLTKLVAIANDYDLWHLKLPNNIAKNLNFLYYYYWGEKFVERFKNGFDTFNDEEKAFLLSKWKEIKKQIHTTEFVDLMKSNKQFKNKLCMIYVTENNGETNELCEYALQKLKFDVVIVVIKKRHKLSTRARHEIVEKGFHVGNIHTELGIGGGHPAAGGGQFSDVDHLERICEAIAGKIIDCYS